MATTTAISSIGYETREVDEGESALILDGYSLLSEVMDGGSVEDWDEFLKSVAPSPGGAVLPKMVLASDQGAMIGFSVGMCLTEIRSGFIAYSAVRPGWRRRGVYKGMRRLLVSAMRREARQTCGRLDYIFSELERSSPLLPWYLDKLRSSVATCRYEQPAVQGLHPRLLELVVQPVDRLAPPVGEELVYIVGRIFELVYRIRRVEAHPAFRRVAASIGVATDHLST